MGILAVAAIAIIFAVPFEALPIARHNDDMHLQQSSLLLYRKYFGKPNTHFKYNHEAPLQEAYKPEESQESDNYIEQLIRDALTGPQSEVRSNNEEETEEPHVGIDVDY